MKISLKNLGVLQEAELELGDLTVICGRNNTGKTYATYALFGFLTLWKEILPLKISDQSMDQLFNEGAIRLNIEEYVQKAELILAKGCTEYVKRLGWVFASDNEKFERTEFKVSLCNSGNLRNVNRFERKMSAQNAEIFSIIKEQASQETVITFLIEKEKIKIPRVVLTDAINEALKEIIFGHVFPNPFIASSERTGAAIFRRDLNFSRNRMMDEVAKVDKNINPMGLLLKVYTDYALPVKINVEFTRQLETIFKRKSYLAEKHPRILDDFADILGGEYQITKNNELYFLPKAKNIKLTMDESSSAARSLLDIGFYLKHSAQSGDLLMVDEPELNLHPENQRRLARLFARLLKANIKVFITTHSDYIIKELNTLIMLNRGGPHLEAIIKQYKYNPEDTLDPGKVRVYIAGEVSMRKQDNARKSRCLTLTRAKVTPDYGIEAPSFDDQIIEMNQMQEDLFFAGRDET